MNGGDLMALGMGVGMLFVLAVLVALIAAWFLGAFVVLAFLFDGLLGYYPTEKDVVLALFYTAVTAGLGGGASSQ